MDRIRTIILTQIEFARLRTRIERVRLQCIRREKADMPGEIREAMSKFKCAHAAAVKRIVNEMEKATADTFQVADEGVAAVRLPHAANAAIRAEIREIHEEFATQTNGGPDGPLPGEQEKSPPPFATSVSPQQPQGQGEQQQPQTSWQQGSGQG